MMKDSMLIRGRERFECSTKTGITTGYFCQDACPGARMGILAKITGHNTIFNLYYKTIHLQNYSISSSSSSSGCLSFMCLANAVLDEYSLPHTSQTNISCWPL